MKTYHEIQRFPKLSLWFIAGINVLALIPVYPKSPEAVFTVMVTLLFSVSLVLFLFSQFRIETEIDISSIRFGMRTLQRKFREIRWEEIQRAYIRKYVTLREYGGWGIRMNNRGKACNISGNTGLRLELKNEKKILLETNKPDELKRWLQQREDI